MRVLHFIDYFSQPTQTFIKRYVQKSQQFADVAIAAFDFHDVPVDIAQKTTLYKIDNPPYSRKNISGMKRFLAEKISGKKIWHDQFQEAIRVFKPAIVHCHFGDMGILMMDFGHKMQVKMPYVTSFYGYDVSSKPFWDKQYNAQLPDLWKNGDAFFAEGPELIKKMISSGCPPAKCIINPLLIPTEEYPIKTNYRQPAEPIKFLFVGRFIEKKGFHIFLEAIGKLKKEIEKFTIDIVGSGSYQPVYEQLIALYGMQANINWLGMKTHQEVIDSLKTYDFLVHPSIIAGDGDSEGGAPTIIIEAQASGLPVITSDHADIPFVMGYDDFLAKENDIDSLIEVIKKIINCNNIQHYARLGADKVYQLHDLKTNKTYEANLKKLIKH